MTTPNPLIKVGSVVQLDPAAHLEPNDGFFAACFMLVTEVKSWGCQGFMSSAQERGQMPKEAYYRAKWDEMVYIGQAEWVPADVWLA
jgi:hypothetical protein